MSRTTYYWYIYGLNDYTGFDFDYVPVPWESHYTHVWADQHQSNGNVYLTKNPNADLLYHSKTPVHRLPNSDHWNIPEYVDLTSIDWRWSPNPADPPYIYAFSNQWNTALHEITATYTIPGATQYKYIEERMIKVLPTNQHWKTLYQGVEFDYSWRPNPKDPAYIYVFGNQWYPAERMPTVEYHTPGATERKFINSIQAQLPEQHNNCWNTLVDCEWDYSWVPDPGDPPFIYVFGNQWYPAERMPTVKYTVPGATEIKYIEYPRAQLLPTTEHWIIKEDTPFDFDFSWVPDPGDDPYIYVFGNQFWEGERSATIEYRVPGATERKFIHDVKATFEALDIFYIDHGNDTAQTRYELLQGKHKVTKVRYVNTIMDTIRRCVNRAQTNKFWVISSEYDYSTFEFNWQPEPWQQGMTHVFPSQHQKWSNTFLINRWEFERHSRWAENLEQFPNLNFVTNQLAIKSENKHNIYYVDHGNPTSQHQYEYLRSDKVKGVDIIKTRFVDNYLDIFKRIIATAKTEYVWIINSICDYTQFDFTWEPEPWQREMVHVFPSDTEPRGDTFYIHVESFKQQMVDLELLDWFNVINYCNDQRVSRFDTPVHYYNTDDLITEIKNYNFTTPYVAFTKLEDLQLYSVPCLWAEKDRVVERFSKSGSTSLIPRDIKRYLKTQVYDYPHIDKDCSLLTEEPQDVIFISNGEPMAEENWLTLARQCPWAKRSNGITGREAAYKAAAELSSTPWFYAVFAKTEVLPDFKFDFLPDYFQEPKHYIFHSRNPLNGLEYGAMNINLYNKQLVLATDPGLDFTLSKAHDVIPICASISRFNSDPWITWRSAFRETMKLQREVALGAGPEIQHRLTTWCTVADGENAEYCIQGALDGVEYYNKVNGDYASLKLSFDWAWCEDYYYKKYNKRIWLEVT